MYINRNVSHFVSRMGLMVLVSVFVIGPEYGVRSEDIYVKVHIGILHLFFLFFLQSVLIDQKEGLVVEQCHLKQGLVVKVKRKARQPKQHLKSNLEEDEKSWAWACCYCDEKVNGLSRTYV